MPISSKFLIFRLDILGTEKKNPATDAAGFFPLRRPDVCLNVEKAESAKHTQNRDY
jgi:hypothetical protein